MVGSSRGLPCSFLQPAKPLCSLSWREIANSHVIPEPSRSLILAAMDGVELWERGYLDQSSELLLATGS